MSLEPPQTLPVVPRSKDKPDWRRKYYYWGICRPDNDNKCSKAAWGKAQKWSLVSAADCQQCMINHLMQSGCHELSEKDAKKMVMKHGNAAIKQYEETYAEREQARKE